MSDSATRSSSTGVPVAPGTTAPAPGSCDPDAERLPAPSIVIGGTSTVSTFGIGVYECGTITGDGYIVYSFNPVLLDATDRVEVRVNSAATPVFTWALGGPFTASGDNVWTSTATQEGCARLTIDLTSPGGGNTSTYGADIRVGGDAVACPQRVIDATDPGDIGTAPVNTPSDNTLPPLGTFATIAVSSSDTAGSTKTSAGG